MNWVAIFDWDGVIIDSSRQHEQAWELLAAEEGLRIGPGCFSRSFGMKNERVIPDILGWTKSPRLIQEWSLRKEVLYRQLVAEQGADMIPGAKSWLVTLAQSGIRCALGTSTPRLNLDATLEKLALGSFFQATITGDDVDQGKPDPEVFLKAAASLAASPEKCVVFEDAPVGLEAAKTAGMKVVALTTTHPAPSLVLADWVVKDLNEVRIEVIGKWFN
jgi:HAD superfamily hydrolase (TIGR01509 family)